MTVAQQARDDLQHDLWLRVATHRAEHRQQRSVGSGDESRAQRVRRFAPRGDFGRVALLHAEAKPAIVQVDAR